MRPEIQIAMLEVLQFYAAGDYDGGARAREIIEPTLTTVAAPLRHMGATGVRNCLAVLHGAQPSAPPLVLPTKFIERQSTGPRRAPMPSRAVAS